MDKNRNIENTNQNATPVFWNADDGKWYFTEKHLTSDFQIMYATNPHAYETPDEAMEAYLESSKAFSQKMDKIKLGEDKVPDFAHELKQWYHSIFLLTASDAYAVTMGYVLYNFLLPNLGKIGEKPLEKVVWTDIEKLISKTCDICMTAKAQTYKFFRLFYSDMMLSERLTENPMDNVTLQPFQAPLKNFVIYSEEEIKKLLYASEETIHFLEVCLMLHGLRYGEVRGLRFSDFDKRNQTVTIRRQAVRKSEISYNEKKMVVNRVGVEIKATKTEESDRVLRMPEIIFYLVDGRRDWLEQRKKIRVKHKKEWTEDYDDYICIADGGKIKSESTLNGALKRICSRAGIPIVTTHNLRHIAATMMFEYGTRSKEHPEEILLYVSEYLGHANIGTTFDIYTAYIEAESRICGELENHVDPILFAEKGKRYSA